jgi:hypothetical protein
VWLWRATARHCRHRRHRKVSVAVGPLPSFPPVAAGISTQEPRVGEPFWALERHVHAALELLYARWRPAPANGMARNAAAVSSMNGWLSSEQRLHPQGPRIRPRRDRRKNRACLRRASRPSHSTRHEQSARAHIGKDLGRQPRIGGGLPRLTDRPGGCRRVRSEIPFVVAVTVVSARPSCDGSSLSQSANDEPRVRNWKQGFR